MATHSIYTPLNRDREEIRILHIQGSSDCEDPVRGDLEVVSFLDDPKPLYEAISYCWAEVPGQASIILNRVRSSVPASAENVLRQFRPESGIRTLWIDAICINQEDIEERSHQVMLMRQVYSGTVKTLAWLGEADDNTERAIRTIDYFSKNLYNGRDYITTIRQGDLAQRDQRRRRLFQLPEECNVNAVDQLFQKVWFSRLWVMQEAVLAPRTLCYCGHGVACWDDLCRASGVLCERILYGDAAMSVLSVRAIWMCSISLKFSRESVLGYETPYMPFHELLRYGRNLCVSQPRDRIYGVLGLTSSTFRSSGAQIFLRPDYRRPLMHVCCDATRAAILELGTLDVFQDLDAPACVGGTSSNEDWPSWVPSWVEDSPENRVSLFSPPISRHTTTQQEVRLLLSGDSPDRLLLKGFPLACISSLLPALPSLAPSEEQTQLAKAYYVTLVTRFLFETESIPRGSLDTALSGVKYVNSLLEDHATDDRLPGCASSLPSNLDLSDDNLLNEALQLMLSGVQAVCYNRRFFRTENGMIGLGPQSVQVNDWVVGLFGLSKDLAILRLITPNNCVQLPQGPGRKHIYCRLVGLCNIQGVENWQIEEKCGNLEPTTWEIW